MLKLTVVLDEGWDEAKEEFVTDSIELELEHSLVSLSKWEEKFEKPFLGDGEKTREETEAYVKFMIVTPDFPPEVFSKMSLADIEKINEYINAKSTATWINDSKPARPSQEVITSELIYYWMIAFNVPFECQHWHFNRLLTLIRVCSAKNEKPKKQSKAEMIAERQRLNAERRAQLNSRG